jgi:hypothetical protein
LYYFSLLFQHIYQKMPVFFQKTLYCFFFIFSLSLGISLFAQNTPSPNSTSKVPVKGGGNNCTPPQIALMSAAMWFPFAGTPVEGTLVYNTAKAETGNNAVSPGYYYWCASRWNRLTDNISNNLIHGVLSSSNQNLSTNYPAWQSLNSSITLPPGRWVVYVTQLLTPASIQASGSVWVRTTFSEKNTWSGYSRDIIGNALVSGLLPADAQYNIMTGQFIINNTSAAPKTYYYYANKEAYKGYTENLVNFSTTSWGENQIYAMPAQ